MTQNNRMTSSEGGKSANGDCGCAIDEVPVGDRCLIMDNQFRAAILPISEMGGAI